MLIIYYENSTFSHKKFHLKMGFLTFYLFWNVLIITYHFAKDTKIDQKISFIHLNFNKFDLE